MHREGLLLLLLLLAVPMRANSELTDITVGIGAGDGDVTSSRAALVQTLDPFWFGHLFPRLAVQVEYGVNRWQADTTTHYAYSLLPVLRWNWHPSGDWQWFSELAIGGSYLEENEIADRQLGSHLQFETRAGLGVTRKRWSWALRGYHYGNGGLSSPNAGLNLINLEMAWRLP